MLQFVLYIIFETIGRENRVLVKQSPQPAKWHIYLAVKGILQVISNIFYVVAELISLCFCNATARKIKHELVFGAMSVLC